MIQIKENKDCCGCSACVQRCPKHCISMREDSEGFLYPVVDETLCIDCSLCEKACPVLHQGEPRQPLQVFAAMNPDEEIRMQSSSGGIFTMLAEQTIEHGGVVFGAAFDERWEVEHRYAETKEGLSAFRGSKYVQSRIGDTFKQAEQFLKQGRNVLFSGTPCQIAGLKLYLRREYDNLLTVDLVCHGVPSPGVFRAYLEEEKRRFAHQREKNTVSPSPIFHLSGGYSLKTSFDDVVIKAMSFRDKRLGWKKYSFAFVLSKASAAGEQNSVSLSYPFYDNPFMKGFLADLYLRPSCYACPAKKLKSGSDITLGDFWGIESVMPEIDDDKGASSVVVNTAKGKSILNSIRAEYHIVSYRQVCQKNPAIIRSCSVPYRRRAFFSPCRESFTHHVDRLSRKPFVTILKYRAIVFLKNVLSKLGLLNLIKR